ncbi:MAG: anthranilate synthase component I family protein [Flavobacteriales bacterium]|nr:anthranilate synthase component I family protein [Flavobacteriales bacterium]
MAPLMYRFVADQQRAVLGIGSVEEAEEPRFDAAGRVTDWWFGHLGYGYKDRLEDVRSRSADAFDWPLSYWFRPKWVVEWSKAGTFLHVHEAERAEALAWAQKLVAHSAETTGVNAIEWLCSIPRSQYLTDASQLLRRIQRGDIYEVNYCIAHEAVQEGFDPYRAFDVLLSETQAPFAGFMKIGDRYALCCSPERFIAFDGDRMIGEPMKGTRPRGTDEAEDTRLSNELANDPKERSENVMAVDVMRNDFSRVAVPGSVHVPELFGVRTHPRVHQMVSVIEGRLANGHSPFDAVKAAFPPASMTGAPKISAMKLIDEAEGQARGLYSGTMGYFAPDGTADLNVVIRTVLFDRATGRLSIPTGSALTAQCDPEAEWEECLVKFNSIAHALAAPR